MRDKDHIMARENYSFKKFQKEQARKKKAEEKIKRRLEKKAAGAAPEAASELVPESEQVSSDQPVVE